MAEKSVVFDPALYNEYVLGGSGSEPDQGYGADMVDRIQTGGLNMGQLGLGFLELMGDYDRPDHADGLAYLRNSRDTIAGMIKANYESQSAEGQAASRKKFITADTDEAIWADPAAFGLFAAEQLPALLVSMLPAGVAARIALVSGGVRGAAMTGAAVGGATEAVMGSGAIYGAAIDGVKNATPEQMQESVRYRHLTDKEGFTHEQAQNRIIAEIGKIPALGGGAASMLLGTFAGGVLGKGTASAFRSRAGAQFTTESVTEGAQEAGETIAQIQALKDELPSLAPTGVDVAEAAIGGAAIGGPVGGGVAAITGSPDARVAPDRGAIDDYAPGAIDAYGQPAAPPRDFEGARAAERAAIVAAQEEENRAKSAEIAGVDPGINAATQAMQGALQPATEQTVPLGGAIPPPGGEYTGAQQITGTGWRPDASAPPPGAAASALQGAVQQNAPAPAPEQPQSGVAQEYATLPAGEQQIEQDQPFARASINDEQGDARSRIQGSVGQEQERAPDIPVQEHEATALEDGKAQQLAELFVGSTRQEPGSPEAAAELEKTRVAAAALGEFLQMSTLAGTLKTDENVRKGTAKAKRARREAKGKPETLEELRASMTAQAGAERDLGKAEADLLETQDKQALANTRLAAGADTMQRLLSGEFDVNDEVAMERLALAMASLETDVFNNIMEAAAKGPDALIAAIEAVAGPMATDLEALTATEEAKATTKAAKLKTPKGATYAQKQQYQRAREKKAWQALTEAPDKRKRVPLADATIPKTKGGRKAEEAKAVRLETIAERRSEKEAGGPTQEELEQSPYREDDYYTDSAGKRKVRTKAKQRVAKERREAREDKLETVELERLIADKEPVQPRKVIKGERTGEVASSLLGDPLMAFEGELLNYATEGKKITGKELTRLRRKHNVTIRKANKIKAEVEARVAAENAPVPTAGVGAHVPAAVAKGTETVTELAPEVEEEGLDVQESQDLDEEADKLAQEELDKKGVGRKKKRKADEYIDPKTGKPYAKWKDIAARSAKDKRAEADTTQVAVRQIDALQGVTTRSPQLSYLFEEMMLPETDEKRVRAIAGRKELSFVDPMTKKRTNLNDDAIGIIMDGKAEALRQIREGGNIDKLRAARKARDAGENAEHKAKLDALNKEQARRKKEHEEAKRKKAEGATEGPVEGAPETPAEPKGRRKPRASGEPSGGLQPEPAPPADGRGEGTQEPTTTAEKPDTGWGSSDPRPAGGEGIDRSADLRFPNEDRISKPQSHVVDGAYNGGLNALQIFGVNKALDKMLAFKNFMLADGTGVGKTREQIAIAAEIAKGSDLPVLIVTESETIITDAFRKDAAAMGVDFKELGIELTTYTQVAGKPSHAQEYAAVIFDEAHNLKNVGTAKARASKKIKAKSKLFATSTPMDTFSGGAYFIAELTDMSRQEVLDRLQIREKVKKNGSREIYNKGGSTTEESIARLIEFHDEIIADQGMLRRYYAFKGTINTVSMKMSKVQKAESDAIVNYHNSKAAGAVNSYAAERDATKNILAELSRWSEVAKEEQAMEMARQSIAEGKSVIIVTEGVDQTTGKSYSAKHAGMANKLTARLEAEGIAVGKIFGGKGGTQDVINGFQANELKAIVMTTQSGGTGINLDDVLGDSPRHMIVLTKNYSGNLYEQLLGRVSRLNTASASKIDFLEFEGLRSDEHRAGKINAKLKILKAMQEGKIDEATVDAFDDQIITSKSRKKTARLVTENLRGRRAREQTKDQTSDAAINSHLRSGQAQLSDMLESIALQSNIPGRKELAQRLAEMFSGLDMPVNTSFDGTSFATIDTDRATSVVARTTGIDPNAPDLTHAVLHEAVHHASLELIARNPAIRRQLERMLRLAQNEATARGVDFYALGDVQELVSEALSNPAAAEFLNSVPYTDTRTAWGQVKHLIKRVMQAIGVGKNLNSVMDQILEMDPIVDPRETGDAPINNRLRALQNSTEKAFGSDIAAGTTPAFQAAKGLMHDFRARAKILNLMTNRQIEEVYDEDTGGTLGEYFKADRAKQSTARKHQERGQEVYDDWDRFAKADPQAARDLNDMMHDSTMARVDPSKPMPMRVVKRDPKKGTKGPKKGTKVPALNRVQVKQYDGLKAQYDHMTPEAQRIYKKVRNYFSDELVRATDALKHNVLQWSLTEEGMEKHGADMTKLENAKQLQGYIDKHGTEMFAEDGRGVAEQSLLEIYKIRAMAGPYFPLKRYGDNVVTATGTKTASMTQAEIDTWLADNPGGVVEKAKDSDEVTIEPKEEGGAYDVTLKMKVVEFHESTREAEEAREKIEAELRKDFEDVAVNPVMLKEKWTQEEGNSPFLNALERRVRAVKGEGPEQKQAIATLRNAMITLLPETNITKARLRRKSVRGASRDMRRNLSNHAISGSHYLASLEHNMQTREAVNKLRDTVIEGEKPGGEKAQLLRTVYNHVMKNEDSSATLRQRTNVEQKLTNLGFVWYLGSASYSLVNATQPLMFTLPYLAARSGKHSAARELKEAYKAIAPGVFNKGDPFKNTAKALKNIITGGELPSDIMNYFSVKDGVDGKTVITVNEDMRRNLYENYGREKGEELGAVLTGLAEEGLLDVSMAMDMREAVAGPSSEMISDTETKLTKANREAGKRTKAAMEAARVLPHAVEVMNRAVSGIAAYNIAIKMGKTKAEAQAFAAKTVADTQFDYNSANSARIMNANIPGVGLIMQFKKHLMHVYFMLIRNTIQGLGVNATKEEQKVALKTLLGVLGTHALAAGAIGATPEPIKWAIGAIGMMIGGDDWEGYDVEMRQAMAAMFGETMGEAMSRGIPRLAGFDLSGRIGIDQMLLFGEPRGDSSDDLVAWGAKAALGPVFGVGANMVDAAVAFGKGDLQRGFEKSTPKGMRDLIRTGGLATKGLTDTRGNLIVDSAEIGPTELFMQALGFQPSDIAEAYEGRNAILGRKNTLDTKRHGLLEKYHRAGSPQERWAVRREIREFNKDYAWELPSARIKDSTLRRSKAQRDLRDAAARKGEVYIQDEQSRLHERGSFANR